MSNRSPSDPQPPRPAPVWVVGVDPETDGRGELEMLRWMQRRIGFTDADAEFKRVRLPHPGAFDWLLGCDHEALERSDRSGLILARRDATGLFPLGPHVRTALDDLEDTTIIVPPTLRADDIEGGGVVVGLTIKEEPLDRALARSGSKLAHQLGLPLHFVHVVIQPVPVPVLVGPSTLSTPLPGPYGGREREAIDAALDRLSRWAATEGFAHASVSALARPNVVLGLRDYARTRRASLLVVGHEPESFRVFAPAASRLAGLSNRPVVVVPTEATAAETN